MSGNLKFKMSNEKLRTISLILSFCILHFAFCISLAAQDSSEYVKKAWALKGQGKFEEVYQVIDQCWEEFSADADKQSYTLSDFPPKGDETKYQIMNDVATCYFIKGEALRDTGHPEEAKAVLQEVIKKYPYAQAFDPRGWFWSIKEKSEIIIAQSDKGDACDPIENKIEEQTSVTLYDEGTEFPVDYSKYGKFVDPGTENFKYIIDDPIGLAKAVGEGIYPNSTSIKFDPEYVKLKKQLYKIDHWEILNSRDLNTAFYKWNFAPESDGTKLFYIADILERCGLVKHAIKAYYAVLVHYPNLYAWTYWHTPWYPSKAAVYRIKYLLRDNPELGLILEGAFVRIKGGYDNDIRNDVYAVNPGKFKKVSTEEVKAYYYTLEKGEEIVETRGGEKSKLVKHKNGDWQMVVEGKPFMIKGITYDPTKIGESPDKGTMENWTTQDTNNNGIIDSPYETWIDANKNNVQDEDEPIVGDFQLMKEMGVNCIRLYKQPFERNKELLRKMHQEHGIYVVIGDFLGKYALGSGASWEEGTDYDNPEHKENMLNSVRKMVEDFKDEPYIIMWLLGNENVYGLGCNADKKPESFFKFANEAAKLIKSLDPQNRPVGIASGDTLHLEVFAEHCPDIDVFGTNCYRGKQGFLDLWDEVKRIADRAVMITEYGAPSFAEGYTLQEGEDYQAEYFTNCWNDVHYNSSGYGAGVAVGGFTFEWLDEWWKAYEPSCHDAARLSAGPFLSGYYREEWFGIVGQGDGSDSPFLRQPKAAYYTFKELWNDN